MSMSTHEAPFSTALTCGLLLLTAASLTACEVGNKPIGGNDNGSETGDGDPGDGDPGDGDPGDGDPGDGDPGDCPPPPTSFADVEVDYQLSVVGDPNALLPLDRGCTVSAVSGASIGLDCAGTDIQLQLQLDLEPAMNFGPTMVGDVVMVWLYRDHNSTWLRLDFPVYSGILFVIDAETLAPPVHFPAPWGLEVVDACGPITDGCGTIRPEQLEINPLGQPITLWPGDHDRWDFSEAFVDMWVGRSHEILEVSPVCDPTPEFFRSRLLVIHSSGPMPVESEVCIPGESNPCATGLHCCYPCGIPGCDFVCMAEDANTLECPPALP
jgi:hypothetical protein